MSKTWEIVHLNSAFGGHGLRKVLIELSPFPQIVDLNENSAAVFYSAHRKIPKNLNERLGYEQGKLEKSDYIRSGWQGEN